MSVICTVIINSLTLAHLNSVTSTEPGNKQTHGRVSCNSQNCQEMVLHLSNSVMNLGIQFQVIPLTKVALYFFMFKESISVTLYVNPQIKCHRHNTYCIVLSGAGCSVLNKGISQAGVWCDVSVLFHTLQSVS